MASTLKQIIQDRPASESIRAFCQEFYDKQRCLRLTDLIDALWSEIRAYSKVFFIINALDECPEDYQGRLIAELKSISSTVYLMVALCPLDLIKQQLEGACQLDINAKDRDVQKYIDSWIRRGQTKNEILLAQLAQNNRGLGDSIVEKIVTNTRGMSVLLIPVSDYCAYCIPIPQVFDGQAAYRLACQPEECFGSSKRSRKSTHGSECHLWRSHEMDSEAERGWQEVSRMHFVVDNIFMQTIILLRTSACSSHYPSDDWYDDRSSGGQMFFDWHLRGPGRCWQSEQHHLTCL